MALKLPTSWKSSNITLFRLPSHFGDGSYSYSADDVAGFGEADDPAAAGFNPLMPFGALTDQIAWTTQTFVYQGQTYTQQNGTYIGRSLALSGTLKAAFDVYDALDGLTQTMYTATIKMTPQLSTLLALFKPGNFYGVEVKIAGVTGYNAKDKTVSTSVKSKFPINPTSPILGALQCSPQSNDQTPKPVDESLTARIAAKPDLTFCIYRKTITDKKAIFSGRGKTLFVAKTGNVNHPNAGKWKWPHAPIPW